MSKSQGTIALQAIVNLLVDVVIALPVLILFLVGKPTIRGFFCDDESLRRPYHDSTISNAVLYAYGFTLPFVVIVLVETLGRRKIPKLGPVSFGPCRIPSFFVNIYFMYVGCLFGSAVSQCITDICKYTIGRLRPHFIEVCNPDFSLFDCTGLDGQPLYVTNYVCRGNPGLFNGDVQEAQDRIQEARASVFVAIYLHARSNVFIQQRERLLLIPFCQFLVMAAAVYISISRVMDNKHHPGDVIAGAILGIVVQIINTFYIMRLFQTEEDRYLAVSDEVQTLTVVETGNVSHLKNVETEENLDSL